MLKGYGVCMCTPTFNDQQSEVSENWWQSDRLFVSLPSLDKAQTYIKGQNIYRKPVQEK